MDILSTQLKDKYPNIQCPKCNSIMNVCLDVFCTSSRIFCSECASTSQTGDLSQSFNDPTIQKGLFQPYLQQNFHRSHQEQIYCMGQLLEMNNNQKIIYESHQMDDCPMSQQQKEVYIKLMKNIDDFEKQIANEFKLLRANINEKFNLISASFDQTVQLNVSQIQNIISKYREDYKSAYEFKIQEILKQHINPVHLNFSIIKSNLDNIQETTLNHLRTIQNQVKLENKVEINQLLEEKWNSSIHDITSYRNCFVLCGEAMRLYTPASVINNSNKQLVKQFDFNISETIRCVQVSRDGSILAAGGNGKLILFNTENMKILFNQVNNASSIQYYSVDISPDNKHFAFSLKNKKTSNNLFIFDISNHQADPKVKQIFSDHNSLILSTKFSNDGKFLLSSGCDYKIIVYAFEEQSEQFKKVQILRDNDDIINDIVISNDSKTLVSVSTDGRCYIYTRKSEDMSLDDHQIEETENNKVAVERQKDFERLNKIKYEIMEEEEVTQKEITPEEIQAEEEKLKKEKISQILRISPHQNPFLAQSLLQDQNYLRYKLEHNDEENQKIVQKALDENVVYEGFEDFFQLQGHFTLVGKRSINSVDIDNSGKIMALCSGSDILVYDISSKKCPQLLSCVTTKYISIINKVKFSHFDNVIYCCDQIGNFFSFKFQ